eukprot:scaffold90157_cov14-Tisochrysis_lutea.AAC.2
MGALWVRNGERIEFLMDRHSNRGMGVATRTCLGAANEDADGRVCDEGENALRWEGGCAMTRVR